MLYSIKNLIAEEIKKEKFKEFSPEFTGKKIAFLDGGNLRILGVQTSQFCTIEFTIASLRIIKD